MSGQLWRETVQLFQNGLSFGTADCEAAERYLQLAPQPLNGALRLPLTVVAAHEFRPLRYLLTALLKVQLCTGNANARFGNLCLHGCFLAQAVIAAALGRKNGPRGIEFDSSLPEFAQEA